MNEHKINKTGIHPDHMDLHHRRKKTEILLLTAVLCVFLAACGSSTSGTSLTEAAQGTENTAEGGTSAGTGSVSGETDALESEAIGTGSEEPPADEEEVYTLGEEYANDADLDIILLNLTGQDIATFAVKAGDEEYSDDLLDSDDAFLEDEKRELFYRASSDTDSYSIRIRLYDGTEYIIHNLPTENVKEAAIVVEDDVAYLEYYMEGSDELISTKADEESYMSEHPEEYAELNSNQESFDEADGPAGETDGRSVTEKNGGGYGQEYDSVEQNQSVF